MKLAIFIIITFFIRYLSFAQESSPPFERSDETKYKLGLGGIIYKHYHLLYVNGRYKFNNKRELGLSFGGMFDNTSWINFEQYALVSYLPLKKKERKVSVDLILTSGVYRKIYRNYRDDYFAMPALVGFDFYYNFHPKGVISFTGNIGPLFSERSFDFPKNSQPFFNFNSFWAYLIFELKYKIKKT